MLWVFRQQKTTMLKTAIVVWLVLQLQQSIISINIDGNNQNDNTLHCPQDCDCVSTSSANMEIDCSRRPTATNESKSLPSELDTFLSDKVERLTSITIRNSELSVIPQSVCQLTQLRTLDMTHNQLSELPRKCFSLTRNLESLVLSSNQIRTLEDGQFDDLDSLATLRLDWNKIDSIGLHVFSNSSTLPRLRRINISNNRLTTIDPWPIIRGSLRDLSDNNLVDVDLSNNLISHATNFIGWRYNFKAQFVLLSLNHNRLRHVTDITGPWGVDGVTEDRFMMKQRNRNVWWINFLKNPLSCDCIDFMYISAIHTYWKYFFMGEAICLDPLHLSGKHMYEVPLWQFVCNLTANCSLGCECTYHPVDLSVSVNCSLVSFLPKIVPSLPKSGSRYTLKISGDGQLRRLEARPYFANVRIIDVVNGTLETVDDDAWEQIAKVEKVSLRENSLRTLPKVVQFTNLSQSQQLSLGHNPWSCACDNGWLIEWLKTVKTRLLDADDIVCDSPSRFAGKKLLRLTESEVCAFYLSPVVEAVIIVVFVVITCAIVLPVLGYRLRFFCYRRWKLHPFDRDECSNENMRHDVFLCCSYDDHTHLGLPLLQQLESHSYSVCYHLRDFAVGDTIENNIMEAIQYSKRVVCLLTTNFMHSTFCLHEFDLALHHTMSIKRRKRLIVLMMLEDQSVLSIDSAELVTVTSGDFFDASRGVRHYMRYNTYLDCVNNSDWFDKLLYALPMNGMLQNAHNDEDDVNDVDDAQLIEL